jgi:ABC-type polysaccharide/polyol phosphate transport system ATPase subunit
MSREIAVQVSGVSVAFRRYTQRATSFKETVLKLVKRGKTAEFENFFALKNISFEVERGSVLGIVGSNGSGKSTLLKVMTQVLPPSSGVVTLRGSCSSLVELGVGFDPELSATENVYLHGSLYKKTKKEMRAKIDKIIDFAELREFKDTPIKYFSSGMIARLGFSAAIDVDPDILIIDEVLAVGDARFQAKCQHVFSQFISSGKTIIMVSHDLPMLSAHCSSIALLSCGELVFRGDPQEALTRYADPSYHTRLAGAEG